MLTKMRSFTHELTKGQLYFRIIPLTLKVTKQFKDNLSTTWVLYLEKGMQILGKTSQFQVSALGDQYNFNPAKNKLDFQIASEKSFNYSWSLYSVDEFGYEQRVVASVFSIKDYYLKYQKENNKTGYDLEVKLNNLTLNFKLFIQNSIANFVDVSGAQNSDQLTKSPTLSKKADNNGILKQKNKEKEKPAISEVIQIQKQVEKGKSKSSIQVNQNEPSIEKQKKKPSPLKTFKAPVKIQEQEQEESHGSGPKNNDSKLSLEIQNINLQPIDEDRQKQDLMTPLHAKLHKPGLIQKAFEQELNKNHEIAQNLQQQNHEQEGKNKGNSKQNEQESYINKETPNYAENESKNNINDLKSSKLMKSSLKINGPPSTAKNNFKKVIITVLLIILMGGIIGSLIQRQKNNQQDELPKKNKKTKVKTGKQAKN